MKRAEEIQILQSLKGDTYFADFFGEHDIDQMCENIKNDFGLELGCNFYQKAEIYQKQVKDAEKKAKEQKENFVRGLIDDFDGHIPSEIYDRLEDAVGKLFIINWKRQQEYPLTEAEIDWLVTLANKMNV